MRQPVIQPTERGLTSKAYRRRSEAAADSLQNQRKQNSKQNELEI